MNTTSIYNPFVQVGYVQHLWLWEVLHTSNKSGTSSQIISLPHSGGTLHGIGENFSPDLHTGAGNCKISIALLPDSTGNGNAPFGLGGSLEIPGVTHKTSKGIPRYRYCALDLNGWDTFVLLSAEHLVPTALWKINGADPSHQIKIDTPTPQDYVTAPYTELLKK